MKCFPIILTQCVQYSRRRTTYETDRWHRLILRHRLLAFAGKARKVKLVLNASRGRVAGLGRIIDPGQPRAAN